jgi:hypothetical protein
VEIGLGATRKDKKGEQEPRPSPSSDRIQHERFSIREKKTFLIFTFKKWKIVAGLPRENVQDIISHVSKISLAVNGS